MPSVPPDTMTNGETSTPPRSDLTPAMRQYADQKKQVGDAVLLFRMGDFYETFWEDAVLCARVLGIALTSRNKGSQDEIPLAGIPYHALDGYLKKLIVAGHKVAISEQLEDPKLAKGVVKRDVVRIVTAGTLTDENLLDQASDNTLGALVRTDRQAGMAFVELASGRFEVVDAAPDAVLDELVRRRVAEVLIDDECVGHADRLAKELNEICGTLVTRRPRLDFSQHFAEQSLLHHFGVTTLAGFGFDEMTPSLCAAGAVLHYLNETQKTALGHIVSVRRSDNTDCLQIDHGSWRSLEIEHTLRAGDREGTLLHAVNRTVHPIGARRLCHWLRRPLVDVGEIFRRQEAVQWFLEERERAGVRKRLREMADVERIAARVALARCSPRDLAALARTLGELPHIAGALSAEHAPSLITEISDHLSGLEELHDLLTRAIRPDPPNSIREGGIIADGFDTELDRLRSIGRNGRQWLAVYQHEQASETGIAALKVGFNRVFGYYIEVPNSSRGLVPDDYVRKQTIKNAERYITERLKQHETEVLTAQERANDLETRLFERTRLQVAEQIQPLMRVAEAIGRLDVMVGLAELACERRYVRPDIASEGETLEIHDGRHPVLDQTMGDTFVPNDCVMDDENRLFVITGPNMAGKSTYIRQVALLTLLAQTGSFVPAKSMRWSVADRIFARVGSADEIMRGRSTFMVEMSEAANILHNATGRSLVILDELGRGTSTFDGLSLAWAITEHLAREVGCRSLLATHYHELIELAGLLRGVRNFNVAVREYPSDDGGDEGIVFLHRIVEGGASKSYGIHVARLAGVPRSVIDRSREVMDELQRGFERESRSPQLARKRTRDDPQLELFGNAES